MENKVKKVGSAAETVFGVSGETQPVALWTWLIIVIQQIKYGQNKQIICGLLSGLA